MDRRKKRKRFDDEDDFFRNFFDEDFEEEFEKIRKHIEELMRSFTAGLETENVKRKVLGPFVYGFSMKVGPDGKPIIHEFGNTKQKMLKESEREPLTDVIEEKDTISISVEIPGVEKEDIDLRVTENELTISVDSSKRKYHKDIPLSTEVIPDSTKATYKNGILDIVIKKKHKIGEKKGKKVNIQ